MKFRSLRIICAATLGAAGFAGCSTPLTRIEKNPNAFARLNPDQQAMVKAGQIAAGMDPDAVKIALGKPTYITARITSEAQTQIWHYVADYYAVDNFRLPAGIWIYEGHSLGVYDGTRGSSYDDGRGGWYLTNGYGPWYHQLNRHVYDRYLIRFQNGKVSEIAHQEL